MRYKKDPDHLYIFLAFSIILHLILFLILPYGELRVLGNNGDSQEYGFIQMVEYREENSQSSQGNNANPITIRDIQENSSIEEVIDEHAEMIKESEDIKIEEETIEKINVPEDIVEDKNDIEDTVNEPENEMETDSEPEQIENIEEISDVVEEDSLNSNDSTNSDILTSDESDIEVEINSNDEQPEQESINNSSNNNENGGEVVENVATLPSPPPTAGELTIGAPPVAYPKDLVGQAVSGTVEIQVHISSNGEIDDLEIIQSSEIEQMDRVAELTIRHGWQFRNYQEGYSMKILVEFLIDENGNPLVNVSQGNLVFK